MKEAKENRIIERYYYRADKVEQIIIDKIFDCDTFIQKDNMEEVALKACFDNLKDNLLKTFIKAGVNFEGKIYNVINYNAQYYPDMCMILLKSVKDINSGQSLNQMMEGIISGITQGGKTYEMLDHFLEKRQKEIWTNLGLNTFFELIGSKGNSEILGRALTGLGIKDIREKTLKEGAEKHFDMPGLFNCVLLGALIRRNFVWADELIAQGAVMPYLTQRHIIDLVSPDNIKMIPYILDSVERSDVMKYSFQDIKNNWDAMKEKQQLEAGIAKAIIHNELSHDGCEKFKI